MGAQPGLGELGNPYPALRSLPVTKGAAGRQRYPIDRIADRQLGACRAGVELRIADGVGHFDSLILCLTNLSQRCPRTTRDWDGQNTMSVQPLQRDMAVRQHPRAS